MADANNMTAQAATPARQAHARLAGAEKPGLFSGPAALALRLLLYGVLLAALALGVLGGFLPV
jgi:hypothetical protein